MPNKPHHSSRAPRFRRPAQGDRENNAPVQSPSLGTNLDSRSPVPSTSGTPSAGRNIEPCHEAFYDADSESESEGEPSTQETPFPLEPYRIRSCRWLMLAAM
uniref:Uncharacterized protein n=1 Tax=Anopheles coluzzii TaxID=1518534 RepID=A0A8W7Q0I7_ANOCL